MMNLQEDLRRWFKEKWTAQDGSECGDYKGKGRVKCRPSKRVSKKSPQTWGEMSGHEKRKAVKLKQKAHKKGHQFSSHSSGKTWKGDKYKHKLKKGKNKSIKESLMSFAEFLAEENKPTNPKLWSKCKSAAKRKFDVYPCVPLYSLAIGKKGPINHEDVEIGDEILTYNIKEDILEWKPVLYKHYYEKADIVEIGKPTGFSLKCTPNHKWVVSKTNINNKELIETKDINTHMKIHMCSEIENESSLLIEGWSKNDTWIEKIISMNKNEREIYLASSVVYDGWDKGCSTKINSRHTFGFSQKEYDHLWSSLLAAYLNGYYVNINERDSITSATYIRNKKYHSTQNLYIKNREPEDVWCPTTENQTWVMIQNGLITITGNSAYANAWAAKCYKKKRKGKGSGWKASSK